MCNIISSIPSDVVSLLLVALSSFLTWRLDTEFDKTVGAVVLACHMEAKKTDTNNGMEVAQTSGSAETESMDTTATDAGK